MYIFMYMYMYMYMYRYIHIYIYIYIHTHACLHVCITCVSCRYGDVVGKNGQILGFVFTYTRTSFCMYTLTVFHAGMEDVDGQKRSILDAHIYIRAHTIFFSCMHCIFWIQV